ncbi:hypothetical protein Tco_0665405 [Tanacetum coccineum]
MKRVAKTIGLMDAIAKINDPQCELLLLCFCTGISRLYFTMRTCPPRVFDYAQRSFDVALRSSIEGVVTASGPGFGDWQWRLATLPFACGGLGVYSAGDVLNYAFLASRLQFASLQTKLRHTSIASHGPIFDDALSVFNTSMETDLLSNPSILLFFVSKPCSTCLRIFARDIYGDHAVSCAGIIGIKHRHNVVCDTLVDICYHYGFSAGKKVDIGLDEGRDKALRPTDMLLYSWDGRLDVELEADAVTLLKRIRKFSMTQDIGARAAACSDILIGYSFRYLRLATLPIKLGGLGILSAEDISKLSVPMFSEGSLCPSCNAHRMDQWGDHAVHCSSEVGVKFRHNLVCDILVDICSKVGIMVRKEAPMGFLSDDGKDLRPADLLLFNWLQGKDACLDVTCISPFAGMGGLCLWLLGIAMHNAGGEEKEEIKMRIYEFMTTMVSPVDQSVGISRNNGRKTAVPRRYGGVPVETCI